MEDSNKKEVEILYDLGGIFWDGCACCNENGKTICAECYHAIDAENVNCMARPSTSEDYKKLRKMVWDADLKKVVPYNEEA